MRIVIDIPKEWFDRLQEAWGWALAENVREAIKNGTPLPKGHGRLIDADAFIKAECSRCDGQCGVCDCDCLNCKSEWRCEFIKDIHGADVIIEADKEVDDVRKSD